MLTERRSWKLIQYITRTQFALSFLIIMAGTAVASANSETNTSWKRFRQQHPFHIQSVTVSKPNQIGERTLIISEPPPTLPREHVKKALASIFGTALKNVELKRHPMGYDGWVEDVIATISYSSSDAIQLDDDIAFLHKQLYGTTYKASYSTLPNPRNKDRPLSPPNLSVSAASLHKWFFQDQIPLTSINTGEKRPLGELFRHDALGVFLSPKRGLVVLLIPRQTSLNDRRADLRKFVLDTDAILGAIAVGGKRLAIIGRERDTPITDMPSLRVESILALAATKEKELGQSYERTSIFAGKLQRGEFAKKDWAPIYLSPDLTNTEFGSILNVTDQILKSWSESGTVEYYRFPYKKPKYYPISEGLYSNLKYKSLTYNWNTTGIGSVVQFDDVRIFALLKSGALPVSYIPEGTNPATDSIKRVENAEEVYYDFFTNRRDPNLARVVQYTALYQIFQRFPVHAKRDEAPPRNYGVERKVIRREVGNAFTKLVEKKVNPKVSLNLDGLDPKLANRLRVILGSSNKFAEAQKDLEALKSIDDQIVNRLTTALVDPKSLLPDEARRESIVLKFRAIFRQASLQRIRIQLLLLSVQDRKEVLNLLALSNANRFKNVLEDLTDGENVRRALVNVAQKIETGYVKTPSIVVSRYARNPNLVGGHNLYSRAIRVQPNSTLKRGQIRLKPGKGGIEVSPQDAPMASKLARIYERHREKGSKEVLRRLRDAMKVPSKIQSQEQALLPASIPVSQGRGLTTQLLGARGKSIGYGNIVVAKGNVEAVRSIAQKSRSQIILSKDQDGFLIYNFSSVDPVVIRAKTPTALVEEFETTVQNVARSQHGKDIGEVKIGLHEGFSEGEIEGILRTQQLRTATGRGGRGGDDGGGIFRSTAAVPGENPRRPAFLAFFSGRDSKRTTAHYMRFRKGKLEVLKVLSRDRSKYQRLLTRRDANWEQAQIVKTDSIRFGESGWRLGYKMRVPINSKPPLHVRIRLSLKRLISSKEESEIEKAIRRGTSTSIEGETKSTVGDRLLEIRAELLREIQADERILMQLEQSSNDFFIVRIEGLTRETRA